MGHENEGHANLSALHLRSRPAVPSRISPPELWIRSVGPPTLRALPGCGSTRKQPRHTIRIAIQALTSRLYCSRQYGFGNTRLSAAWFAEPAR